MKKLLFIGVLLTAQFAFAANCRFSKLQDNSEAGQAGENNITNRTCGDQKKENICARVVICGEDEPQLATCVSAKGTCSTIDADACLAQTKNLATTATFDRNDNFASRPPSGGGGGEGGR